MSTLRVVETQHLVRSCANPACDQTVEADTSGGGRPRRYCGEPCKRANASRLRSERSKLKRRRKALSDEGVRVGVGELVSLPDAEAVARTVGEATEVLAGVAEDLRRHTRDWVEQPAPRSPDGRTVPELAARVSRDVATLLDVVALLERRVPARADEARACVARLAQVSTDLIRMLGVEVPPNTEITIRDTPESIAAWFST